MTKLYPLSIILVLINLPDAGQPRFMNIVRQYENHEYFLNKRNVTLDFNFLNKNNKPLINPENTDTAQYRDNYKNVSLAFHLKKLYGSPFKIKGNEFSAIFNGIYDIHENTSDLVISFLDTVTYIFEIKGKYDFNILKYLSTNNQKTPFIQLASSINGSAVYSRKNDYLALIDPHLPDSFKSDREIIRNQKATAIIDLTPAIGIGKQSLLTPVYQVFRLEEKLIRNGLADRKLSDKTLISLAELLAKNNSYTLKKHDKIKEFKTKVDSIVIKDEAVKKEKLRYVSPLEIKKILLGKTPVFYSKPLLRLFTTSRILANVSRVEIEYPYDVYNEFNDTSFTQPKFCYEHLVGMDFVWGIPVTHYWFINFKGTRNLLSTDNEIDFYNDDKQLKWDNVLDARWNIQSSLWLTNWLLIQLGLNNLPAWIVIPRELPYHSYMNLTIFVEDYLSLTTAISSYNYRPKHYSYLNWYEPANRIYTGTVCNISATYNF